MILTLKLIDALEAQNHYLSRIAEALERSAPPIPIPATRLRGAETVGILNVRDQWRKEQIKAEAAHQLMEPEEIERLLSESDPQDL